MNLFGRSKAKPAAAPVAPGSLEVIAKNNAAKDNYQKTIAHLEQQVKLALTHAMERKKAKDDSGA